MLHFFIWGKTGPPGSQNRHFTGSSVDGGKTWQEAGLPTKAFRIVLDNLVPGTTYLVRARAIGGSTGASNWTSPGSIMST